MKLVRLVDYTNLFLCNMTRVPISSMNWLGVVKQALPVLNNTDLPKNFPRINFQHSVSFSPAEYEYERHFFPLRPDFQKFYNKGLKINKIRCLWLVFMLKLTNNFNVLHR